ncbi:MAG: transcriptional regulator [Candidatus Omnitrophica bacterium CG07_land_8_20_14_0_80_50_8]|nr:MAG: transcriptional regulator [Candidatus Omnitrophica bacterium CG07_land_8_20_14_0_80_50_8]
MKTQKLSQDIVYKIKADFLRALSHPLRLKIIEILKHGEKSVGALVKQLGIQQSSLSRHLLALRDAGVLKSRQERTMVFYSIQDHDVFHVLRPIAVMLRKKFKESERVLNTLGKE